MVVEWIDVSQQTDELEYENTKMYHLSIGFTTMPRIIDRNFTFIGVYKDILINPLQKILYFISHRDKSEKRNQYSGTIANKGYSNNKVIKS